MGLPNARRSPTESPLAPRSITLSVSARSTNRKTIPPGNHSDDSIIPSDALGVASYATLRAAISHATTSIAMNATTTPCLFDIIDSSAV